jgi:hypothetical protein
MNFNVEKLMFTHAPALHARTVHAYTVQAHTVRAHTAHSAFYVRIKNYMPTVAIVAKPVFHR